MARISELFQRYWEHIAIALAATTLGIGIAFAISYNANQEKEQAEARSQENIQYITDVVRESQAEGNKATAQAIDALLHGINCMLLIEPPDRTTENTERCIDEAIGGLED